MPKEIIWNENVPKTLKGAVEAIKNNRDDGPDFFGIPYKKYKVWADLTLNDRRTKPMSEKKQMRSFRLSVEAIKKLKKRQMQTGMSGAKVIESLLSQEQ